MLVEKVLILLAGSAPVATVVDRFGAMKNLNSSRSHASPWFSLALALAIIGLVLLFFVLRRKPVKVTEEKSVDDFVDNADKYGLTAVERRLITTIARCSGISDANLIFTTPDAFFRGAAKLMHERYTAGENLEDRRHLKNALEVTSQKLGFTAPVDSRLDAKSGTSRQIPVGRKVYVTAKESGATAPTEAKVKANSNDGLVLELGGDMKNVPATGALCHVRYQFGTSIWEFESAVTGLDGNTVRLAHCEVSRFTNRRRFLRVPVKVKAWVAHCDFQVKGTDTDAALPRFVSARVIELAGPGLRIETTLNSATGKRLFVIMTFENGEVIRDMALVRDVKASPAGFSMALEMVTLGDAEISTLVSLTNLAARKLEAGQSDDASARLVTAGRA